MIYFISDLHLQHKNILKMQRPEFNSLEEMHNHIIDKGNLVVNKDDIVYVLGDGELGLSKDKALSINQELNGTKILVKGNHDKRTDSGYYDVGFSAVLTEAKIKSHGKTFVLTHVPKQIFNKNHFNVHGHLHRGKEDQIFMKQSKDHYNVCCEVNDYKPKPIHKILRRAGEKDLSNIDLNVRLQEFLCKARRENGKKS